VRREQRAVSGSRLADPVLAELLRAVEVVTGADLAVGAEASSIPEWASGPHSLHAASQRA